MQDEHWRIGATAFSSSIVGRRFGELMLGEPTHHPNPLRRRRTVDLRLQHAHGVGQRANAVPAQFHVVVKTTPDDVHMTVDQSRDDAAAFQVDDLGAAAGQTHHVVACAHGSELPAGERHGIRLRIGAIERGELAVDENQIGVGADMASLLSASGHGRDGVVRRCGALRRLVDHRRRSRRPYRRHRNAP